ncbi:hypothetical protein TNCV_1464641 [Trichonephila clavipes]|nr:hypothetical protein TNCV_1464641 [Trichonephila clavipes]
MATSEIRRTDRRGATPDHVLYMAMKMLRIRVVEVDTELHSILDDEQVTTYGTTEVDVEPQQEFGRECAFGWSFQIQAWANYVE